MLHTGPTEQQRALADANDVKLRLGVITYTGKQKGVDFLTVADLFELARNRAISDAILLSGDEDVRIGVQVAQTYGVRVHLLGIQPCGDNQGNQSRLLRQESDTSMEWNQADIGAFLSVHHAHDQSQPERDQTDNGTQHATQQLDTLVDEFVRARSPAERKALPSLGIGDAVPLEIDRLLLLDVTVSLGRRLQNWECRHLRQAAKRLAAMDHSPADSVR